MNPLASSILSLILIQIAAALAGCGDNLDAGAADAVPTAPDGEPAPDAPPAPPPGLRVLDFALAIDVTPDGRTAVFEAITLEDGAVLYLHDTVTGDSTEAVVIGDPTRSIATGIAATGRISAFHGEPTVAGVWTAATGWTDLGSPHAAGCGEADVSSAFDLSADGSVVVGLAWNGCAADAFRWTDAGGGAFTALEVLGAPFEGQTSPPANRATVISDDGRIAAGFAQNGPVDRSPAIWNADGTGFLLDPDDMDAPGEVLSIDADGATAAGVWGNDGFVWTAAAGRTTLPRLELSLPSDPVYPNAMSADGALVFGGIGNAFFSVPIAFVWSAAHGTRALADVAAAAGVEVPAGLTLTSVLGASADGTVAIGVALDARGQGKTFVLRLPAAALR
jgi:hypothetical protein